MKTIKKIVKFNPYIASDNMGDLIISEACDRVINEIFDNPFIVNLSTRDELSYSSRNHVATSDFRFVGGTNLLSSDMKAYRQWNIDTNGAKALLGAPLRKRDIILNPTEAKKRWNDNRLILLGVGWWKYQDSPTKYTSELLNMLLDKNMLHSVRDGYTENKLKEMGINNVINTGCPTLWYLNEKNMEAIPSEKAKSVVTTLTDYNKSPEKDSELLKILCKNYRDVYIWIQSVYDYNYLEQLGYAAKVKLINPILSEYEAILGNQGTAVDYVGTRLHAGIKALQCSRRTIIVAIDNRAIEMGKDIGLPIITREQISNKLEEKILLKQETRLNIPFDNIRIWKEQFR